MRFIHTGDFHLKMSPERDFEWSKDRKRELYETFENIVLGAGDGGAKLLLIAGDLFHEQPKRKDLKEADSIFGRIPDVHVVIVAGNHDYISANSPYRDFEWSPNVTFLKSDMPESVYFEDINTEVYGFSYHERMVREDVTAGLKPKDSSRINILMVHGGTPEDVPFDVKALEKSGFDYVALGHIHKPDEAGNNVRYCGSPEPLDRNETGKHGYISGYIDKSAKEASFSFVEASKRKYYHEIISVDAGTTDFLIRDRIKGLIAEKGGENYFCIELKGKRDPDITIDTENIRKYAASFMHESADGSDINIDGDTNGNHGISGKMSGDILSITDKTVPDYDFDRLQAENGDNVVGMFIESVRNSGQSAEIIEKALNYGMEALRVR